MIYFIQDMVTRLIKIGTTDADVNERLRSLQTGCPGELVLLQVDHGGQEQEARLHQQFSEDRERGEWFRPSPEILSHLLDCAWHHGQVEGFKAGWTGACKSVGEVPPPVGGGDFVRCPSKNSDYMN